MDGIQRRLRQILKEGAGCFAFQSMDTPSSCARATVPDTALCCTTEACAMCAEA